MNGQTNEFASLPTIPAARKAGGPVGLPSINEILGTTDPDGFVARYSDIGAVNLACATGLPMADVSEFPKYLALLDTIAESVRKETERSWRLFKIKPGEFHHSPNVFRVLIMEHVFRVRYGIRYDPVVRETLRDKDGDWDRKKVWNSADSTELFIHGLLSAKRTGTCSSLPTFSIAVARRLGYPLKLILVPNHTLYRWDDGKEVFNLQPSDVGGDVRPDEYFYEWPRKWDEIDHQLNARTKVWLHSLTPRKELSKFLCNRALMLRDIGRHAEALLALDAAVRFDPINPACTDIRYSVEYAMAGGDVPALLAGRPTYGCARESDGFPLWGDVSALLAGQPIYGCARESDGFPLWGDGPMLLQPPHAQAFAQPILDVGLLAERCAGSTFILNSLAQSKKKERER